MTITFTGTARVPKLIHAFLQQHRAKEGFYRYQEQRSAVTSSSRGLLVMTSHRSLDRTGPQSGSLRPVTVKMARLGTPDKSLYVHKE